MDVRCERCRAQYTFEDDQVTPEGVMVQCSVCGHQFQVKKPELGFALPLRSEPPRKAPSPAPPPPPPAGPPPHWTVRQASGQTLSFSELNVLQRWIVERKVGPEDEVTPGDGTWVRLGTLSELQPFFEVVAAADRVKGRTTSRYPAMSPVPPSFAPPVAPPPSPTWAPLPPGPAPTPAYRLAPPTRPAGAAPSELDEADLRAVGRSNRSRNVLLALLLLLVAGAAIAYVFMPALLGRAPPPPPAAPLATVVKPEPPPPPPQPPPRPEPEVKPEVKPPEPEPAPEPKPEVKPRPKPPTTGQQLAEARRLREGNRSEQALDLYGRIIGEEPENAEALAGRGLCYFDLEQYAPAEASLQAALRLSPTQPDALLGLAETYRAQGRKAEAIALFERYLAAHPGGDEAPVARNAINQLKE